MSAPAPSPLAIVDAEPLPRQEEVLTEAALAFVAELHRRVTPRRAELIAPRAARRAWGPSGPGGCPPGRTNPPPPGPGPRPRPAAPPAATSPRGPPRSARDDSW